MGDKFMKSIEPIASKYPYMVIPGNHEYTRYGLKSHSNMMLMMKILISSEAPINYKYRYFMPGGNNDMYTFTLGLVRFIGISTEYYYKDQGGSKEKVVKQFNWLESILTMANRPEERQAHPWIVVMGHRPPYCAAAKSDCKHGTTKVSTFQQRSVFTL